VRRYTSCSHLAGLVDRSVRLVGLSALLRRPEFPDPDRFALSGGQLLRRNRSLFLCSRLFRLLLLPLDHSPSLSGRCRNCPRILPTSLIVTSLVRQLRTRRDELPNVLHAMPVLAWNFSANGMADFSNKRFRDHTGLSFEALSGWGWMNVFQPKDSQVGWWRSALASGHPIEREVRVRAATGEYR
jgi:PAS domain-containing protein